jgi:hypothetical protein
VSCADAIAAFGRRDFADWRGLPGGCGLADVEAAGGTVASAAPGQLGARHRPLQFHVIHLGEAGISRAWVEREELVLMEAELPAFPSGPERLVEHLGPPEARREIGWDVLVLPDGEWVWPASGLAAIVNPGNAAMLALAAFTPTGLAEYDEGLRRDLRVREFRTPRH